MIGIVIPVLNEESCLRQYQDYYELLSKHADVVFVDGGSSDKTVELAQFISKVVIAEKGRAQQKNAGAKALSNDVLLFLHADTFISIGALWSIESAVKEGAKGGCLTMKVLDSHFALKGFECLINWRAKRLHILDGDLGVFVHRAIFEEIGKFDLVPYMEDIFFARKLKRQGSISVLQDGIDVSTRKWYDQSFWPTFAKYSLCYWKYWTGQIKPMEVGNERIHSG